MNIGPVELVLMMAVIALIVGAVIWYFSRGQHPS
jgi:hypothetical protein